MYMAACLNRMLPDVGASIYVLEFADNMLGSDGFTEARDAISSIASALRARNPLAAIVVLVPFPQSCTRALKKAATAQLVGVAERCLATDDSLPALQERLATEELHLPCLSLRHALAEPLRATARNGTAAAWLATFMRDAVHPNQLGHTHLATLLADAVGSHTADKRRNHPRACPDGAAGPLQTRLTRATASTVSGAFARETNAVCAFGFELKGLIRRNHGWQPVVEWSGQHTHRKPGYVAKLPGAAVELCFAPPEAAVLRGEVFEWNLGYLRSYSGGMGAARAECTRGCSCPAAEWDGHIVRRVSEHTIGTLHVRLPKHPYVGEEARRCACVVRLTDLNRTSSRGHKFKLVSVMTGFFMYVSKYVMAAE
jgi:hypothetical protein